VALVRLHELDVVARVRGHGAAYARLISAGHRIVAAAVHQKL
jgi:hypothetical protein